MIWWQRAAAAGLVALVVGVTFAQPATPHVRSTVGYSKITSDGSEVSYELSVEYELLARAAGLGPQALDAADDQARSAELAAARSRAETYLDDSVDVFVDDVACEMRLDNASAYERDDLPYARLVMRFECPGSASGSYRVDYRVFAESDGVVDDHTNVVDYDLGGEHGQVVLDAGHTSFVAGERTAWSSLGRFIRLGVEHILTGADHVLFVVALLLGAASLRGVAKVVTAFTVAHSVTLALASLGLASVPSWVIEPLIALSIVYVAAENVLDGNSRHRLAVVFGFGLLHGLGFASTLQFSDEFSWGLVASLAGFNLGIEVGQAALVLVLFPALAATRRFRWSAPVRLGATAAVAVMGLIWFFQRIVFT